MGGIQKHYPETFGKKYMRNKFILKVEKMNTVIQRVVVFGFFSINKNTRICTARLVVFLG